MGNRNLRAAKEARNDEFYTQLHDIENELRHYQDKFQGKVLYMNTDHPDHSKFYWHFKMLFEVYGLKKLIATFWGPEGGAFKTVYDGKEEKRTPLKGDGDFRSDECVEILKKSDVVVTNPPFSLFREYVSQLMKYEKEFLIIGNSNATTYKEIFPLIKDNKMWYGATQSKMEFIVPDYAPENSKQRIDSEGVRYQSFGNIVWFTNIEYPKRYEDILLWTSYKGSEDYYPKYHNYNAININRVTEIPYDYEGVMGVPISFIGKWNPKQFKIVGLGIADLGRSIGVGKDITEEEARKLKELNPSFRVGNLCYFDTDGELKVPYARVLIRNLNPVDEITI